MKVRNVLGLVAAVPALVVALAAPGNAATTSVVTFAGQIKVRPTPLPQLQTLDVCFVSPTESACPNTAVPNGTAAGQAAYVAGADLVDGLQARATYVEPCAPVTGMPVIGTATLTGRVHEAVGDKWSPNVSATWFRAGLVAVIQGGAVGTALFTPIDAPACGVAGSVAVAGVVEAAY